MKKSAEHITAQIRTSKAGESSEQIVEGSDVVLYAIGRIPAVDGLNLEVAGIPTDANGHIIVDEYQNVLGRDGEIYALGDVCGKALLTPGSLGFSRILFFIPPFKKEKDSNFFQFYSCDSSVDFWMDLPNRIF